MNTEIAIDVLKQATIETTTGCCKKCPIKDKNKTCIGCLDEAKEIVLNQLQQKENIIKEVREYIESYMPNYDFDKTNLLKLLEILDKGE